MRKIISFKFFIVAVFLFLFHSNATIANSFDILTVQDSIKLTATIDTLIVPDKIRVDVSSNISASSLMSSYQFKLNYNSTIFKFDSISFIGTASNGGLCQVNANVVGSVQIAWAKSSNINSTLPLLKFYFSSIDSGKSTFSLSNVYFNSSLVTNISNKSIVSVFNYGDVDDNNSIQAYDASIDLKYSVGLDPIPAIDPLPWEAWRVKTASVDNLAAITANDASLILKYTVGLISQFPKRGIAQLPGYLTVAIENGEIVFRSFEDMGGVNINFKDHLPQLDSPSYLYSNSMYAVNKTSSLYKVAFAFITAPSNGTVILKVPFRNIKNDSIVIELLENSGSRNLTLNFATGINHQKINQFNISPNPSINSIHISNISPSLMEKSINIIDGLGKILLTKLITSNGEMLDISGLPSGVYYLNIGFQFEKFIKL